MALTLNYSKVGVILNAICIIGFICVLIILPPLGDKSKSSDDDGLATYELLETELDSIRESQREALGEISNLRGELTTANESLASITAKLDEEFTNNLERGDDIMESGILIDENKLITNEVERRLQKGN